MRKRYLYPLLFGVPTLFGAALVSSLLLGAVAGALWLFVFGDAPWPAIADNVVVALLVATTLILWGAGLAAAYWVGKGQEASPKISRLPLMIALGATALLVLTSVLQQVTVGNIGVRSEGLACADYCRVRGYAGSGTHPSNQRASACSCYDARGRETTAAMEAPKQR